MMSMMNQMVVEARQLPASSSICQLTHCMLPMKMVRHTFDSRHACSAPNGHWEHAPFPLLGPLCIVKAGHVARRGGPPISRD